MQAEAAPPRGTGAVVLVGLMALSLFINYVDRGNLATGATQIRADLGLSATAYGALGAGFYFAYAFCQLPAGTLSDRIGGKRVLALGALLWSVSTLLTGFVQGFLGLFVLRMMLGIGESVAFTTTSKIIASNVPKAQMGLANGVIGFGYLVGPAAGTLIGGLLMAHWGWRTTFMLFGAVSLLWLLPWSRVHIREVKPADNRAGASVTLRQILSRRALWGAALGHFAGNWNWYFILGYLPMYLEMQRGFSKEQMAEVVSSAYLVNALAALFAGWAFDKAIQRGWSPSLTLKAPLALAHLAGLGCMLAMPFMPIRACIALLFVYEICLGFSSPAYFMIPQIMAGPSAAARWVGVQNMMGNMPGVIGVFFAGVLIDAGNGSYGTAFLLAGLVNVLGLVGWVAILPRIAPVDWETA
ncbi:MFS transporter [Novosphingobium fuchskuhlense]|uniref:MFS transporter n=1 Tax=Novosphingobium fuchskuhlense TaxID=1117702 RepID=UPI0009EAF218|nr:MFS transporter [Novosphingobium fuchskuhlense]